MALTFSFGFFLIPFLNTFGDSHFFHFSLRLHSKVEPSSVEKNFAFTSPCFFVRFTDVSGAVSSKPGASWVPSGRTTGSASSTNPPAEPGSSATGSRSSRSET